MKFIFKITIKEGHTEQDYIEAWKKGNTIIQESIGAEGTVLYRKTGSPGELIAIATWKSKESRDATMKKLDEAGLEIKKVLGKHKTHGNTEVIGNFEEIARVEPLRDR